MKSSICCSRLKTIYMNNYYPSISNPTTPSLSPNTSSYVTALLYIQHYPTRHRINSLRQPPFRVIEILLKMPTNTYTRLRTPLIPKNWPQHAPPPSVKRPPVSHLNRTTARSTGLQITILKAHQRNVQTTILNKERSLISPVHLPPHAPQTPPPCIQKQHSLTPTTPAYATHS